MTTATEAEARELPILFKAPMVRAILEGRKTQTRRVIRPQPHGGIRYNPFGPGIEDGHGRPLRRPPGLPGDLLYVRENARLEFVGDDYWVRYQADEGDVVAEDDGLGWVGYGGDALEDEAVARWVENGRWKDDGPGVSVTPWRAGMLVPKALSRIWLRVTDVRVERVQEITLEGVNAEGTPHTLDPARRPFGTRREQFQRLWDSINADRGHPWESNPWVWCVSFERAEAP